MKYEFISAEAAKSAEYLQLSPEAAEQLNQFSDPIHFEALKQYANNTLVKTGQVHNPLKFYLKLCYNIASAKVAMPSKRSPTPWPKPKLFKFSPEEPLDDIAEAIKAVGYVAAGIQGAGFTDMLSAFQERAKLKIKDLISEGHIYKVDLPALVEQVEKLIDHTIEKHKPELDSEVAKANAFSIMSLYTLELLRPFTNAPQ